ncbi:MAG: SAM-dependent methyltransferase [Candidatus Latescibacterota bacterium]|jgi:SAM-dependent methyltransferase
MILSDFFCCPHTGQALMQDETAAYSTDREHRYEIVDGVADFHIDGGGAAGTDDEGNRKWLETDAVDGRDLYYERCREWEGMSFCLEQISRLSYNKCRILEVGAGTGHFSRWICDVCQPGTQLYTFDYSWPCLRKTQTKVEGHPGVFLFRANARGPMPFAAESFDIILQRLAPFNAKGADNGEKMQRILDLLAPGGHYLFAGWEDDYGTTCDHYTDNGFARAQYHRWQYPYSFEDREFVGGALENGASLAEAEEQLRGAKKTENGLFRWRGEHLIIAQK